jgi:hypothetical protein
MNEQLTAARSIVVERVMPHPPDLARSHLGASDRTTVDRERLRAAARRRVHVSGEADGRLGRNGRSLRDGFRSAAKARSFPAGRVDWSAWSKSPRLPNLRNRPG